MMHGGWGGWGWMMLMPLLWIIVTGLIVWAAIKLTQRPSDHRDLTPRRETAQEILDRRLASGEIDVETYIHARDTLAGKHTGLS